MNKKMRAAQIGKPGRDFELAERDIPEPGAGQVRVNHEIAERVDTIGDVVVEWKKGHRRARTSRSSICAADGDSKYPLTRVADAYEQMHNGKVRFRVVLTMEM